MNKQQYHEMLLDLKEHPNNTNEILEKYRKMYKNIYPFGDGTFKEIWANKHKKERKKAPFLTLWVKRKMEEPFL